MKKLFIFALISTLIGCTTYEASTGQYHNNSNNFNLNQTQVVLSEANFRVVKHVQAITTYRENLHFDRSQLLQSAYANLIRKADLRGAQTIINVTIEQVYRIGQEATYSPFTGTSSTINLREDNAIIASGTVIEFINPNAPQEIVVAPVQEEIEEKSHTDTTKTMSVEEMMTNMVRDFVNKHSHATLDIESIGLSEQQLNTCYNSFLSKFNEEISSYSNFRLTNSETDLTTILQLKSDGKGNYTATIQWVDKKTGNKALSELGSGDINTLSKTFVRLVRSHIN